MRLIILIILILLACKPCIETRSGAGNSIQPINEEDEQVESQIGGTNSNENENANG